MLKSELLEKLKDIAEDADINETIQGIDGLIKPFDVANATIDDYKNMLANNEVVKAYYQSSFDSAVGSAVTKHDENFKKNKLPKIIEEEIKKRDTSNLTPEQLQIKEMKAELDAMKAEKERAELLNTNSKKLKDQGLSTDLAKYIQSDEDITFFKQLLDSSVQAGVKERLGNASYEPPKDTSDFTGKITWQQVVENPDLMSDYNKQK